MAGGPRSGNGHDFASPGWIVRSEREAAKLSLSELARRSGVGKATLSRWESGASRPDSETLSLVLETLGVDEATKVRAFALIGAPRGIRALRQFDRQQGAYFEEVGVRVPAFGDVLRALRIRNNLTAAEMAAKMGVARSTLSQWELSERVPSAQILQSLAAQLGASEAERSCLVARQLPTASDALECDALVAWLERLVKTLASDRKLDAVEAVCFESEAWRLAQRDAFGAAVLGQYYNVRAGAHCEEFAVPEVKRYAKMARDLPYQEGPLVIGHVPDACLAWIEYGTVGLGRMDRTLRRLEQGLERPLNWYQRWAGRLFLARFYAEQHRTQDMEHSIKEAAKVSEGKADEGQFALFRSYLAECWDAAGEPAKALDLLPDQLPDVWAVPSHLENTRASALVSLGELDEAKRSLDRVMLWVDRYGIMSVEVRQVAKRYAEAAGISLEEAIGWAPAKVTPDPSTVSVL
ncbi:MAG: helix-turn-helix transcriptional regulator [Armatimonadetes bacterium]|nr:helix-turn-helix transcriptional regulator [Armatimonadota bacterium]